MERKNLQVKINEIKGSDRVNNLISFMLERGYTLDQFINVEKADAEVIELLNKYFGDEIAVDNAVVNGDGGIDMNNISKIKKKSKSKKVQQIINDTEGDKVENNPVASEVVEETTKTENVVVDNAEQTNNESSDNAGNTDNAGTPTDNGTPVPPTPNAPSETPRRETKAQVAKKYKTIHNIVYLAETKHTVLDDVREVTDTGEDLIYSCELNGSELATLFLSGVLVYDPTMQRGLKEDAHGEMIANFKDYHVKEIYESMKNNSFTPTQIHLGVITDDEDLDWHYNTDSMQLAVTGRIRLIDGQHRTRALAKILNELKVGRLANIDIDKYVFNVQIHVTNAEHARIIYSNIDKNLKLDKSQVRQLSADHYARVINALNQHSDSPLKGKIATSKPVGNKLVLFNNIADAVEKNVTISSGYQREDIIKYLKEFFDYLTYKLPQAFGDDDKARAEFRKNNLLNENNAFAMWIKVAFLDEKEYKKNIDHIISNVEYFNKDKQGTITIDTEQKTGYIWLLLNTVKHKQKGEGFAMNNTNTGINAITNQVVEMLGGDNK